MTIARLLQRIRRRDPGSPERDERWMKARILIWALVTALIIGVLGAGQPVEDNLRVARNMVRKHPPSGQIVVVGIDDRSVESLGAWPWPRSRHADLIRRLHEAGVRRIFFDFVFLSHAHPEEDRLFAQALSEKRNVYLAATLSRDMRTRQLQPKLPSPMLRQHADMVSIAVKYSNSTAIRQFPYAVSLGGRPVASIAAKLANVEGDVGQSFPIDYSVDLKDVKTVSVVDILADRKVAATLRGKDVIVALASHELGDLYFVPGHGLLNGVYVTISAAETLRRGVPTDYGWLPALLFVALCSAGYALLSGWRGRILLAIGVVFVTVVPIVGETRHIFIDVVPAIAMLGIVAARVAWYNFRTSYRVRGAINAVSGLPNLVALRGEKGGETAVLVAARIRNFAEISATLQPAEERALVEQIVARLALGSRGARIFQGDEGTFAWLTSPDAAGLDQLDALHALFRSPALLDGRTIDLSVTFGTDADGSRDLASRINSTLVAADEAAAEGLRWKAYDSAKLADAEWKLSLLGQLDAAIDSGEVWVAYQPQLHLSSGRITGAEALVRWSHPEKGQISPAEFVLAAENHDRIDKLTEFVLSDAIQVAAAFEARGVLFDVAVNISARLLERPGLVALVRRLLDGSGLSMERLTLEVTESAALAHGRAAIRTLEELGSLGINLSIDDYGTGFSTLEYFKKVPATEVKIDKSFIEALDRNVSDRLMVKSTVELAHSLGRIVVAEGVETPAVLHALTELGCDKAQGYLIGKPMKLQSLTKLILDDGRTNVA